MDSKNELLDTTPLPKEDQLIPKVEPIDVDFIKKEKNDDEEECFVVPGIVESLKNDEDSVKVEVIENEEIENCSSSNVRNYLFYLIYYCVLIIFLY